MINLDRARVTAIQFFDHSYEIEVENNEYEIVQEYSANVVVDEYLIVQLRGNQYEAHRASIPDSDEQYYNHTEIQEWACANLELNLVEEFLEKQGIENNYYFLKENGEVIL